MAAIIGDLILDNADLKAKLAESRELIKKFKADAKHEGGGHEMFGKIGEQIGDASKEMLAKFGLGVGLVAGAEKLHEGLEKIAEDCSEIQNAAVRLNTSTDVVQRLGGMAEASGTDLETVVTAIEHIQRSAEKGDDPAIVRAFRQLNLESQELIGKNPEQVLERLSAAFNEAQQSGQGNDAFFQVAGKGGQQILSLVRDFQQRKEEASKVPIISAEDIGAIHDAEEGVKRLWKTLEAFAAHDLAWAVKNPWKTGLSLGNAPWMRDVGHEVVSGLVGAHNSPFRDDESAEDRKAREKREARQEEKERNEKVAASGEAMRDIHQNLDPRMDKTREEIMGASGALEAYRIHLQEIAIQSREAFGTNSEEALMNYAERLRDAGQAGKLREVLLVLDQIRSAKEGIRAVDEQAQRMEDARNSAARAAFPLMSLKEQSEELRNELAKMLGIDQILSGKDVKAGLDRLREEAEKAKASGDQEAERVALQKLQRAEQATSEFAGSGQAGAAGEAKGALNVLFGKQDTLIVDEARTTNRWLERIDAKIGAIDRASHGDSSGFGGIHRDIFNLGGAR